MLYRRQLIAATERESSVEGTVYHLRYGLYRETTPTGGRFYAITCHMAAWRGQSLVREDWDVTGGLGADARRALTLYQLVAAAPDPVFPCHLADIVRDQATSLTGHKEEPGCASCRPRRKSVAILEA